MGWQYWSCSGQTLHQPGYCCGAAAVLLCEADTAQLPPSLPSVEPARRYVGSCCQCCCAVSCTTEAPSPTPAFAIPGCRSGVCWYHNKWFGVGPVTFWNVMNIKYIPVFLFLGEKNASRLWQVLAAALRSRSRRSGRPMSHVCPHADVYTLVVENKLIRAVSWEKVCRPLFCVHTTWYFTGINLYGI